MTRLLSAGFLALLTVLPAASHAQANVLIYSSERFSPQFQAFRDSGVAPMLSKMASLLGPDFKIITRECGVSNAWYDPREQSITLCYEYLAEADSYFRYRYQNVPVATKAMWKTGIFMHVLFHELGHAAIHLKNIPVLGGEESAADQFSTIMMLEIAKANPDWVKTMLTGSLIYQWNTRPGALEKLFRGRNLYANEHPLDEQRVYDIVCLAYGSNPQLFLDLAQHFHLPQERATRCQSEYHRAAASVKTLFK